MLKYKLFHKILISTPNRPSLLNLHYITDVGVDKNCIPDYQLISYPQQKNWILTGNYQKKKHHQAIP